MASSTRVDWASLRRMLARISSCRPALGAMEAADHGVGRDQVRGEARPQTLPARGGGVEHEGHDCARRRSARRRGSRVTAAIRAPFARDPRPRRRRGGSRACRRSACRTSPAAHTPAARQAGWSRCRGSRARLSTAAAAATNRSRASRRERRAGTAGACGWTGRGVALCGEGFHQLGDIYITSACPPPMPSRALARVVPRDASRRPFPPSPRRRCLPTRTLRHGRRRAARLRRRRPRADRRLSPRDRPRRGRLRRLSPLACATAAA